MPVRKAGMGGESPSSPLPRKATLLKLVASGEKSGAEAGRLFGVSKATVSRLLSRQRLEP